MEKSEYDLKREMLDVPAPVDMSKVSHGFCPAPKRTTERFFYTCPPVLELLDGVRHEERSHSYRLQLFE